MRLFISEYHLLQKDMFKLIPSAVLLSILGIMISAKNGIIHAGTSSEKVLQTLFGSADQYPMNWIYWIIFCVGYVILLQIVWKSRVHMFEINQLLRYRNTDWFWMSKFVTGFLFTCFYVSCFLLTTWITCFLLDTRMVWSLKWLIVFLCLTFNLYGHALLWLAIKVHWRVEAANILVMALLYAGVKVGHPFLPLYYGMVEKINPFLFTAFLIESVVIFLLCLLILRKAKTMDYIILGG